MNHIAEMVEQDSAPRRQSTCSLARTGHVSTRRSHGNATECYVAKARRRMATIRGFVGRTIIRKAMGVARTMLEQVDKLPDVETGERLRVARESAKLTQAEVAKAVDVARTTIIAIEQGQRRVRIDELQRLVSLYNTSANAILRPEAVHIDMIPRFRKLAQSGDGTIEAAARLLNNLVRAEVELENALGIERSRNYPPERPILPGNIRVQAEQDAQELRNWLGLGAGPILDVVSVLDLQLGIRVYLRRFDGKVSGLFAYDETAGACVLLNANHPDKRIRQTAIHELAHFVATR